MSRYRARSHRTAKNRATSDAPLEKQVERWIINAALDLGFAVTKLSQPRNTMQTEGVPDLYLQHPPKGFRCWLEVKREGGKVSKVQAAWHELERKAGGIVIVADSVTTFLLGLKAHGFPVEPASVRTHEGGAE